jgi:hypothetical protein
LDFSGARYGKEFAATTLKMFVGIFSAAQFFTLRWSALQLPSTLPARSTSAGHVPGNLCRWVIEEGNLQGREGLVTKM